MANALLLAATFWWVYACSAFVLDAFSLLPPDLLLTAAAILFSRGFRRAAEGPGRRLGMAAAGLGAVILALAPLLGSSALRLLPVAPVAAAGLALPVRVTGRAHGPFDLGAGAMLALTLLSWATDLRMAETAAATAGFLVLGVAGLVGAQRVHAVVPAGYRRGLGVPVVLAGAIAVAAGVTVLAPAGGAVAARAASGFADLAEPALPFLKRLLGFLLVGRGAVTSGSVATGGGGEAAAAGAPTGFDEALARIATPIFLAAAAISALAVAVLVVRFIVLRLRRMLAAAAAESGGERLSGVRKLLRLVAVFLGFGPPGSRALLLLRLQAHVAGAEVSHALTPREIGARILAGRPAAAADVSTVLDSHAEERYGERPLSPARAQELRRSSRRLWRLAVVGRSR
jgi:hypothetical protein